MITFLLSPIMTFFSTRLYRQTLRSGIGRGFAYLAYLTALFCLLLVFLAQFLLMPLTRDFIDWLIQVTPEMTLTQSGLKANISQPYLVKHPAFDVALYSIDTTKNLEELMADQSRTFILIGKEYMVGRNPYSNQPPRVIDLKKAMEQAKQANRALQLTKPLMHQIAQRFLAVVIPLLLLMIAPFFFIWKLLTAFFYFLIALLLNLFRKDRFPYRSLFTLACYAITPVTVIQAISLFVPGLSLNLNVFLAIALTVSYLTYGMFVVPHHLD